MRHLAIVGEDGQIRVEDLDAAREVARQAWPRDDFIAAFHKGCLEARP